MEKRKRYTVQIKTEISQAAAYFIDQIVELSQESFKSRSDFVRKSMLLSIASNDGSIENYFSKEEKKAFSDFFSPYNKLKFIPPPEDIIKKTNPTGNEKRKRYTVQIRTELSKDLSDFLNNSLVKLSLKKYNLPALLGLDPSTREEVLTYIYKHKMISRSEFLRGSILETIVKFNPYALEYFSDKEKKECEKGRIILFNH